MDLAGRHASTALGLHRACSPCPALVVHGDVDAAIPIERGRALADGLGGPTTFVEVSGAGHSANLEDPGTVNAALLAFLADLA